MQSFELNMNTHRDHLVGGTNGPSATLHDYFEKRANFWHDVYAGSGFISRHMNERKARVLSLVDQISQGKSLTVLDLGCGAGILTQALLERGHQVVGLDGSESMLKRLAQLLAGNPRRDSLHVVHGSIGETSLPNSGFDVIVCVGVIQYQVNETSIVREIGRLLKDRGACIFTLPNLLCVSHLTDPLYLGRSLLRFWTRFLLRKELRAGQTGFYSILGEQPTESQVYNKKYMKWEIQKTFDQHGMHLRKVSGFGYGPFTFLGKGILPETLTIRISEQLTRLSQVALFRWLSYFANRWVFLAEKS